MKKLVTIILIAAVLGIISVYVFIPSKIEISNVRYIKAYQSNVIKFLNDSALLNGWWRSAAEVKGDGYYYEGCNYKLEGALSNLLKVGVQSTAANTLSTMVTLNIYLDSSALVWSTGIDASANPFERISQYNEAKKIKNSMSDLSDKLKIFLDKSSNLYGIDVKEIQLKDSLLISTKIKTTAYPSTAEIYTLVKKLKDYAASQQASPTNFPMLNVTKFEEMNYQVMAGLPINKTVKETNDIRIKQMPFGGNMFTTEIKGGYYTIQEGYKKFNDYFMDSKRASPAIPYELMITDRSVETDTSKWVTRLYYPIM